MQGAGGKGARCSVQGVGCRVQGAGCRVETGARQRSSVPETHSAVCITMYSGRCAVQTPAYLQSSGFRVEGSGFRVEG